MSGDDAAVIRPATRLRGELRLPGDKSISHRALLLAAMARGQSRIEGCGDGADVRSTAALLRRLGVSVDRLAEDAGRVEYRVSSPGSDGLDEPDGPIDCGNSGTTLRLAAGILAGLPMTTVLDGDASLRRRPVARIIDPLRSMGAVLHARRGDTLPPLTVVGRSPLRAADVATAVPSAQVKSAILLAGLRADGRTTVREVVATRDHTERMLRARGVPLERVEQPDGVTVSVQGGCAVQAIDERVPGDVSAAAFWLVAGAIHADAELTIRAVGVNPTRRAVIDLLRRMGASIEVLDKHHAAIEGPARLHGAEVEIGDLRAGASLILAALAAEGATTIHGAHHVHRGYENIERKFLDLGARIERVAEGASATSL